MAASLTELRPWMPWAQDVPTVQGTTEVLTDGEAAFDADEEWQFVVGEPDSDLVLGAVGLHRRGPPDTVEIGYWIRTDATRRGLATGASRALTTAAFNHLPLVTSVEIRMDSGNSRSAAVPPKLGFRFDRHVDHAIDAPGQCGRWMVWRMERADWNPVAG